MRHEQRFTKEKIAHYLQLIEKLVYRRRVEIPPFRYRELSSPLEPPPVSPDVDDGDWAIIEPYSYWGSWMRDFVLRTSFRVPEDWDGSSPAVLHLPLGDSGDFSHPEALVYIDGVPYASCDRHHREIPLPGRWRDGGTHVLALHGWTGLGGEFEPTKEKTRLFMRPCVAAEVHRTTRDFIAAARVALETVRCLGEDDPVRDRLLNALNDAFLALDTREPLGDRFYGSVEAALGLLRNGIGSAGAPLDIVVAATGHSHIDVAWLWTLGQTRRKVGRTFHTVLRLMEQFPDYHFTQSQAQLYEFMRRDYPELFEAVKKRAAEGRWEVIGGMWVEADCNLSGPESLVRQFLLGRTFFREHFGPGAESPVLWLPDVFGYSWSLPQLIKLAGLEYFFTIKISWNQYNRLPYDTFWWQGIDGTRVLTHFSTTPDTSGLPGGTSTYNAKATPEQVIGTWRNFQQKETNQELLMVFGYGDGGGGPTREMLENIREMESFPGLPRVRQKSVGDFFRRLESEHGDELPVWNGELYLELHRGTYTTQARNKRANRKTEFLLHDAEFLAALAGILDERYGPPADDLREAWKLVCLNQFHDIIPGSSIRPVYVESLRQYGEAGKKAGNVRETASKVIAEKLGGDVLLVNPTSFPRYGPVFVEWKESPFESLRKENGARAEVQWTDGGCWVDAGGLPPYSVTPLHAGENGGGRETETGLAAAPDLLENDLIRVELNEEGDIVRIHDKETGREILPEGTVANRFLAFEDRPVEWDAWDVFIYYDEKCWTSAPASERKVVESGPLRATIETRRRILESDYTQRISLSHDSKRIDFETVLHWRERHVLLKAEFPVDILSPEAAYEIQWGNVKRPTHRNTSWDWARFETCAQKWVDLSEGDYGVSLLNDCKYGHDVRDNVIRLSLLRGTTSPDPEADMGEHRFSYSLFPHTGPLGEATIREAYVLNDPVFAVPGRGGGRPGNAKEAPVSTPYSLVRTDSPNVVIETVKPAENGEGMIVRLYEALRRRGRVTLTAGFDIGEAWITDLLEENIGKPDAAGRCVTLYMKPFQITTVRLVPK